MASQLLDLPAEILERILILLSPNDIGSCLLCNHFMHEVVQNSVQLQYIIALYKAGCEDNTRSSLSLTERCEILKRHEKLWLNCEPSFTQSIQVPFRIGGLYDLSCGLYFLGDRSRRLLSYVRLPTHPSQETPKWETFSLNDHRFMVDFGVSVDEHDLIAVITS
jgi:hypothetical protein